MRWIGVFANRRSLAAAGLAFALWTIPIAAGASFSTYTTGSTVFQSNTLAPATNFSGSCVTNNKLITMTWTPTTSSYASGYSVSWSPYTTPGSATVSGASTSSYQFTGISNTTFTVRLTTFFQNWTSTTVSTTVTC